MKRCKFLTLMFALLLLLQSSVLAANTDTTVTVTLPTFAVTLNDTKIDSAHSEYPLIVYRDITYFPMTYHASRFLHLKSSWYQTEPRVRCSSATATQARTRGSTHPRLAGMLRPPRQPSLTTRSPSTRWTKVNFSTIPPSRTRCSTSAA